MISCESGAVSNSDVLQVKRLEGAPVVGALSVDHYYAIVNINEIAFFAGNETPPVLPGGRIYEYHTASTTSQITRGSRPCSPCSGAR